MFKPDFNNIVDAANNKEAKRTPLYEHLISDSIMERVTGRKFAHLAETDLDAYFKEYCRFFLECGYDTVTYEGGICAVLPFGGALAHPRPGYIDGSEKLKSYPFNEVLPLYIKRFKPRFDALARNMPEGMKAIGGVGYGIFEVAQDLTGYENLAVMLYDEPEAFAELFVKVGDVLVEVWKWLIADYSDAFCVMRFGDDLGFRSNTLLPHDAVRENILPQYKRIIDLVHAAGKPFLLHSCGCIFDVMDDVIATGINAKHSNEDQIADFKVWVDRYGDRIGNFGGIDTDNLVRMDNAELVAKVTEIYNYCSRGHGGFAIGSGNSIPAYVDPEKYMIMIDTVRKLRGA
jgi:uroporphyrinogen decarboxylase